MKQKRCAAFVKPDVNERDFSSSEKFKMSIISIYTEIS